MCLYERCDFIVLTLRSRDHLCFVPLCCFCVLFCVLCVLEVVCMWSVCFGMLCVSTWIMMFEKMVFAVCMSGGG